MNRSDLVATIAESADLTTAQATAALDATLEAIMAGVAAGSTVSLPGFGTFEARERAARTGRNPQTGEAIEIAAGRTPGFKAGAKFKERLKG
jgi:DNA-binding protein HU-beta